MTVRLIDLAQEAISAVRSDCHDLSTRQKQRVADEAVEALFAALKGIDVRAAVVAAFPSDTSQGVSDSDGREAFEKWCTNVRKLSVKRMPDGAYLYLETRHAWFGWLESRAALRSEPGEKS